jgi:hypothetical protein
MKTVSLTFQVERKSYIHDDVALLQSNQNREGGSSVQCTA